ncbi:competence lipoprotein ComL [gamma proteobacterium HdN1]|nr:competence lipoprotein ComL [gamma proteobacterium HdN1]
MWRLVCLVLSVVLVAGCASTKVENELSERQYYEDAQKALKDEQFSRAVERLEALNARYPFGRYAEQAQLDLVYAYYRSMDYASSGVTAERFIRMHPDHTELDYAYYMKGLSTYSVDRGIFERFIPSDYSERDLEPAKESFNDFSRLLNRFPNSIYAPDARKRMVYLRNLFAEHELKAAHWNMRRGAYVASANRARYVVENFDRTPAMAEGLAILYKSYRELGLNDLANDTLKVLVSNYPHYPELDAKGRLAYTPGKTGRQSLLSVVSFGLLD